MKVTLVTVTAIPVRMADNAMYSTTTLDTIVSVQQSGQESTAKQSLIAVL